MAKIKFTQGSFLVPQQVKMAFSITGTVISTAIGFWFLNVIGVEARIAHTLGDFIRLVSESA